MKRPPKSEVEEQIAKSKIGDKFWRMNHLYKIKTKNQKLIPLKFNQMQKDFFPKRTKRDKILKARQLGFTTLGLIDMLDETIFNLNTNTAIIAHQRDKVQVLFEIVRMAFDNMPEMLKPRASYDNRNELYFPELNSKIYVALDTRGETVHNLYVSELAFLERAEERMPGLLESVPKDGRIVFETTANGMSGYFYQEWETPDSEFRKHFYNWLWEPEYYEETLRSIDELEADYRVLSVKYNLIPEINKKYGLTKEQFQWYINKAIRLKEAVVQEYPTSELEAFIASGRNVFNISDLNKHQAIDPVDQKFGNMLVWERPLEGFKYVLGVDPSEGIGGDNSVIEVFNAYTGFQAAEFCSNRIPPDLLAGYCLEIGNMYNKALLVPEINGHGMVLISELKNKYWNIYRREVFDKLSKEYKDNPGWKTTSTSKVKLVDDLEKSIREESISVNSADSLKELKTFVRTESVDKQGFGAEGENKDDRVMAMGLAIQGIKYLPRMKAPESIAEQKLKAWTESKGLPEHDNTPHVYTPGQRGRQKYRIRGIHI